MTMRRAGKGKSARRSRQGFTLVELLIVVVIIGILAIIAIPKFANTKGKAWVSAMRSDLRNFANAQEAYWSENQNYYNGPVPVPALQFTPTPGVVITIVSSTVAGWSARATAPGLTAQTCVVYYGAAPPIPPATADGAVACS
jgi:type IV pilus assembly protein PilA